MTMFSDIAEYPSKFTATYKMWGNLYRGRFYIDGKRVPEWKFGSVLNARIKHDSGYNRTSENIQSGYRITWKRG